MATLPQTTTTTNRDTEVIISSVLAQTSSQSHPQLIIHFAMPAHRIPPYLGTTQHSIIHLRERNNWGETLQLGISRLGYAHIRGWRPASAAWDTSLYDEWVENEARPRSGQYMGTGHLGRTKFHEWRFPGGWNSTRERTTWWVESKVRVRDESEDVDWDEDGDGSWDDHKGDRWDDDGEKRRAGGTVRVRLCVGKGNGAWIRKRYDHVGEEKVKACLVCAETIRWECVGCGMRGSAESA